MGEHPTSILLSVGTELTEGTVLNTHFRFLGAELKGLGFQTLKAVQIPDDPQLFRRELSEALASSQLAIITGGLGPTSDDLTREVVAEICQAPLRFDRAIWNDLVSRYSARGRTIAPTNRKQAQIPSGFHILPNRAGTAPGFTGEAKGCMVMALPGPPAELEEMFLTQALAFIRERFFAVQDDRAGELVATALMIPESALEQALLEVRGGDSPMLWSTRLAHDRIVVTLRGSEAEHRQRVFRGLREHFGALKIREGDAQPSQLLFDALKRTSERIALAESCTGGLISKLLTDIPGSSEVLWGALVTYSNESKTALLGVPESLLQSAGAVSAEVAAAMSAGLLENTPAESALAVTGIAGPEGGSADKPVGTVWISGRRRNGGHLCKGFYFPGSRDAVRRRTTVAAFMLAECVLLGINADHLEY